MITTTPMTALKDDDGMVTMSLRVTTVKMTLHWNVSNSDAMKGKPVVLTKINVDPDFYVHRPIRVISFDAHTK